MPTRSKKSGKSAASKKGGAAQRGGTKPAPPKPSPKPVPPKPSPKPNPPVPPAPFDGVDPPVIVQGGGSVTIYSKEPFVPLAPTAKYPFVYYNSAATIGKMKMHGKGGDKDDDSDNGKFTVELYSK